MRNEAKNKLDEYKKLQKDSNEKISDMLKNAESESQQISKRMMNEYESNYKKRELLFKKRLKQTTLKAKEDIKKEILEFALNSTKKRVINELSEEKNNTLIKESINEIKIKLN